MKKKILICLILLAFIGCKTDSKQTTIEKKDSTKVKVEKPVTTTSEIPAPKECTQKEVAYESEQTCIFRNAVIEQVYQKTIQEDELEKVDLLQTELPKENLTKEINNDGLVSISYTITPGKIEIEFLYEGGVTTLSIEQQGKDVKRVITYSAD